MDSSLEKRKDQVFKEQNKRINHMKKETKTKTDHIAEECSGGSF